MEVKGDTSDIIFNLKKKKKLNYFLKNKYHTKNIISITLN